MSVKDQLSQIERYLIQAKLEDEKLEKGVKSAAPKVRASLLEIGKLVSESRKAALDAGKAIPVRKRAPKEEKKHDESPEDADNEADAASEVSRKPARGRKPKVVAPEQSVIAA